MIQLPHHPLDHPGTMKILLGQTASDLIAASGAYHYASIHPPDATSPPDAAGRLVLVVTPLSKELSTDAANVALGLARAVRIKPPKP